jgi:hypothetical protein
VSPSPLPLFSCLLKLKLGCDEPRAGDWYVLGTRHKFPISQFHDRYMTLVGIVVVVVVISDPSMDNCWFLSERDPGV